MPILRMIDERFRRRTRDIIHHSTIIYTAFRSIAQASTRYNDILWS